MPTEIYRRAQQFRRDLLARDRKAAARLIHEYVAAHLRISALLKKLTTKIDVARLRGEVINVSWLMREERYSVLLAQTTREMGRFADSANGLITREQGRAIARAITDSTELMELLVDDVVPSLSVSFNTINRTAVENLIGFLSDGSPLKSLLDELPREARLIVERGLIDGIILGRNPRAIAREIRAGLGSNLARALRIARTETLRAYRETTHLNYLANADIIDGWFWVASLSGRTCAACVALHGSFHPLTRRQPSHVQCRCTQVPGFQNQPPPFERGPDWFVRQPAEMQKQILDSKGAYDAYRGGLELESFVGLRRSQQRGDQYVVLSAKRAIAGESAFPSQ